MGRPKRKDGEEGGEGGGRQPKIIHFQGEEDDSKGDTSGHPLLNHLVLSNVFEYSKILDPDFKSYRLVCKTWDVEVLKKIRPSTKIDVFRIIKPFPDGLGWTEENKDGSYQAPCPFENVEVNGTCENLQDTRLIKWLQVMGENVKCLRFYSGLTCYHHVRFLECVLKQWCPNLSTLIFNGVKCLVTFLYTSKFVDPGSILCSKNLKELIISVGGESVESQFNNCQKNLPRTYLNSDELDFAALERFENARIINQLVPILVSSLLRKFPDILINESSDDSSLWTNNVTPPISQLGSLEHQLERSETDGGVLGQILKDAVAVDSMTVGRMPGGDLQWKELIGFLHCRPNSLQKTLKKFHCSDLPCQRKYTVALFQLLRYPLASLKIDLAVPPSNDCITAFYRFLNTFSGTLEHLEVGDPFHKTITPLVTHRNVRESTTVKLPVFPQLKNFVNRNVETCPFSGFNFLPRCMPNLEKCTLFMKLDNEEICMQRSISKLIFNKTAEEYKDQNVPNLPLKELKMSLPITESKDMKMLMTLLPGLCKVDLVISDCQAFADFFRLSNSLCLEDVKILFHISWENPACEESLIENMRKKEKLKFLQLVHRFDTPAVFSETAFREGFAKAPKLTSLKMTNVGIFGNVDSVRECLKHLCSVDFERVVFMQKFDRLKYSSGQSTIYLSSS